METNRNSFIGVFDSGIGGLTLLPALQLLLPKEKFLYVSDDAHAPYGLKSREEILERCNIIVQALIDKGCKVIVVACNTATTNAIDTLRAISSDSVWSGGVINGSYMHVFARSWCQSFPKLLLCKGHIYLICYGFLLVPVGSRWFPLVHWNQREPTGVRRSECRS